MRQETLEIEVRAEGSVYVGQVIREKHERLTYKLTPDQVGTVFAALRKGEMSAKEIASIFGFKNISSVYDYLRLTKK